MHAALAEGGSSNNVVLRLEIQCVLTFLIACPTSVLATSSAMAPAVCVTFSAVFCASFANYERRKRLPAVTTVVYNIIVKLTSLPIACPFFAISVSDASLYA